MTFTIPTGIARTIPTTAQAHAVVNDSDRATTAGHRECDTAELTRQIGIGNLMAISGRRVFTRKTGVTLPVSAGYSVAVDLAADDTYTVRRVFTRAGKSTVKGERTGVHCEQIGETAYMASCFRSDSF